MANDNKLIVGLDIGTSKVVAIVGEINLNGELEIIGIGSHRSTGLKGEWLLILNLQCNLSSAPLKKQS